MKAKTKKASQHVSRPMSRVPSRADLLFEIGTEELPAAYLPELIEQLAQEASTLLRAQHLALKAVESFGTPRRLVLIVRGLEGIQRTPAQEVRGPSKKAAYDAQGKPTPALAGFVRSQGGTLEQVKVVASDKGEYVYLMKPPTTTPTAQVLPQLLPQVVQKLRAPKTMRWDAGGVRFARPIRWLAALYGSRSLRVPFGGLTSEPATWVGAPLRPKRVPAASAAGYAAALARAGVMLDHRQRRAWIEREVAKLAARSGSCVAPEMIAHGLLDEVAFLVERPVTLVGSFDPKYLALPRDVLLASMAKHQRVFAVESRGTLLPQCIAILEGQPGDPELVRATVERILNARLADSLLFWEQDRKRSIARMAAELSGVAFHERLGSMADKAQRLSTLAPVLAEAWQLASAQCEHLSRACELAKADLVSTMVKEFPTLQGVMGKYYALESKEPREVAEAIEEHYLPAGAKMPSTLLGRALAILDKYDTLTSYFALGIEPTGDQDPFGLRRAAQGIIEVTWITKRSVPLNSLFEELEKSAPFWGSGPESATRARRVIDRMHPYILERLYSFEWPAPMPGKDLIDAVLAGPCDDLWEVMNRIVSLQAMDSGQGLLKAAKVIERTGNILKSAPVANVNVDPARLQEPPEKTLWEAYDANRPRLLELMRSRCYAEATKAYGEAFYDPLHAFFDQVMVNVKEEAIRQNRLALMKAIHTLYTEQLADLSKLSILHTEAVRS